MFARISNAWELSKASWAVLQKDRELAAIPLLSGLVALLAFAVLAGPITLAGIADDAAGTGAVNGLMYLGLALGVLGAGWIISIGQAAVIAGAGERMDGGDPTISSAFARARTRAGSLLGWTVMATAVSVVLDQIEERLGILGSIISWFGSVAFRVMSFLALPIIVFEDVGAIEGFKRSSALVKRTWGEQVAFNFGMSAIVMLAIIPLWLVASGLASSGVAALAVIGIVGGVVGTIGALAISEALSGIFKTALYRHANGLPVDPAFDTRQLTGAFGPRGDRSGRGWSI